MLAGAFAVTGAAAEPRLEHVGTFVWERPEEYFGGWSGIEVTGLGNSITAIGDNGQVFDGIVERDALGRITGIPRQPIGAMRDTDGMEFFRKSEASGEKLGDSEGLAMLPALGYAVSFERSNRLLVYTVEDEVLEFPPFPEQLSENAGVEALAWVESFGLVAIPESVPAGAPGFPIWGSFGETWETLGHLDRSQGFRPVGADAGPDGRLYVLERAFRGVGFQSRVRVIDLTAPGSEPERLWVSAVGAYDNLEGLAVWESAEGEVYFTMISDDNFNWFQKTEIVEFRLTE